MNEYDLFMGYMFEVEILGYKYGFSRIDGLRITSGFEPLMVGGKNDGPVMLRTPSKENGTLTLERGKHWAHALRLSAGQALYAPKDPTLTITITNDFTLHYVQYRVQYPYLDSIEISGFDAKDSAILIEKLTIAHSGIAVEYDGVFI